MLLCGREEAGKTNTAHTLTHEERESKGEAKVEGRRRRRGQDLRLMPHISSPSSLLCIFYKSILDLDMKGHLVLYPETSTSTLQITDGIKLPELKIKRM